MNLFIELQRLMVQYRFKPDRKKSQHFLIDTAILDHLQSAIQLSSSDQVLEIGPGTGVVTRVLCEKAGKVVAIELDDSLVELLKNELSASNFTLIPGNALTINWPSFTKLVSFPPYAISSELILKLVHYPFEAAFLVFQREFVERVTAEPGFLDYNALSVIIQYYCEPTVLFSIPSKSFFPKPASHSILLKLIPKKRFGIACQEPLFEEFIKQLFRHKNKNLSNAFKLAIPFLPQTKSTALLEKKVSASLWAEKKVYLLDIVVFVKLFNQLYK